MLVSTVGTARAAPAIQYGLQDDAWLAAGPGPNTLPERIALLKTLGVKVVRYNLLWNKTAPQSPTDPTDPSDAAYDWAFSDPVVNALHDSGIPVLLTIYGTPPWANGDHPPAYAPTSATAIAGFATAAARRYPWVKKWAIWNEPNEIRWLRPVLPSVYTTKLLNPAYTALHQAIPGVQVGAGVTAPRGNTGGLSPIAWITGLHSAHARFDAYAHNPYPSSPFETPFSGACKYCTTVTMASMPRLISTLDKYFGNKPIWLTEYGYQTNPPDRTDGVSLATQARYVSEAGLRAYQLPQVTHADPIPLPRRTQPRRLAKRLSNRHRGTQTRVRRVQTAAGADRSQRNKNNDLGPDPSPLGTTALHDPRTRPRQLARHRRLPPHFTQRVLHPDPHGRQRHPPARLVASRQSP